ncbi:MAG TPA: hypothetical protein VFZ25_07050 [Chloroflexota bacterium]|nr:hypothetical protein [Chloroflexota bacterium]
MIALVETLPLTVLLMLLECAVGGMLILLMTDLEGNVSRGFLVTSGLILAVAAGLTYLLRFGYGDAAGALAPTLAILTLLLVGYSVLAMLDRRRIARVVGVAAVLVGCWTLFQSVVLQTLQVSMHDAAGLFSLALATLVAGAALTALLLGHWYLVTPLLSAQSLRRVTEVLLIGIGLQVLWLLGQILGFDGAHAAASIASYGFVFWFRVVVGLAFPLILGVLTWRSCKIRAMQTATGLLYIALGCVLAGDAAAKVFSFLTSVSL